MLYLAEFVAIPILLALGSLLLPVKQVRIVVPIFTWAQLAVVAGLTFPVLTGGETLMRMTNDFAVDQIGSLFILLSTAVSASCLSHAIYYFHCEKHPLPDRQIRIFYAAANLFLLTMTIVFMCDNLGALWIAVELTTLTSSPLVYFDRTKNAIEATWKYLIICSVGIAFALLGTILLFASSQQGGVDQAGSMQITELMQNAQHLNYELARLGVIFCILGYGTKAGVFPLHNWLPDAHSEAPAPASAMLSGALLNCALFAIWRITQIFIASRHTGLIVVIAVAMGAVTAVAASLMLIKQHSFKRMWAYSSIENVGIMLVTIGMGAGALFFLQALNHSIAKVALFLVTGNIVQSHGTKRLSDLHGVITSAPSWAILLALGTIAITGAPPFGMFVSELAVLISTSNVTYWPVAAALLLAISISFVALCTHIGRIISGAPKGVVVEATKLSSCLMPALLMACSLILGFCATPTLWVH